MAIYSSITGGFRNFRDSLRMRPIQALTWFSCWLGWSIACLEFSVLSFTLTNIATYLHVETAKISNANTVSLLSRALGGAIFGIAGDQYGRKLPLLADFTLCAVTSLGTGFIKTEGQLIAVRFLYGIGLGGAYGLVVSTALEAVPRKARGIVSGSVGESFAVGSILASGLSLAMVGKHGWRSLYFLAAGLMIPAFLMRLVLPSYSTTHTALTTSFLDSSRAATGGGLSFIKKVKYVARTHPYLFIYMCTLTACILTREHGVNDVYPAMLRTQRHLPSRQITYTTIITSFGAVFGAPTFGVLGHRYSLKWVPFCGAAISIPFLALWALSTSWHMIALGGFMHQFFFGAAGGNLGHMFQQMCPHAGARAAFAGVAYNIGAAISSIAPTTVNHLAEHYALDDGTPDYAHTQLVFVVISLVVLCLGLMPAKSLNPTWDSEDPNAEDPHAGAEAETTATAVEEAKQPEVEKTEAESAVRYLHADGSGRLPASDMIYHMMY